MWVENKEAPTATTYFKDCIQYGYLRVHGLDARPMRILLHHFIYIAILKLEQERP